MRCSVHLCSWLYERSEPKCWETLHFKSHYLPFQGRILFCGLLRTSELKRPLVLGRKNRSTRRHSGVLKVCGRKMPWGPDPEKKEDNPRGSQSDSLRSVIYACRQDVWHTSQPVKYYLVPGDEDGWNKMINSMCTGFLSGGGASQGKHFLYQTAMWNAALVHHLLKFFRNKVIRK